MKSVIGGIFLLVVLTQVSNAQPAKVAFSKRVVDVEKWDVVDISFTLARMPSTNPFEVVFGAVFLGPENENMDVPGFYNGDNEWILRFSASKTGTWRFSTYSSFDRLSGQAGTVNVLESTDPSRRGAVKIDPDNPQYFVYEDGSQYFSLIYELDWLFALDHGNKSGIPRTEQIVKDIRENGFNQVVMNVYAYDVRWPTEKVPPQYEYGKPGYTVFKGTNENPDFSSLSTDFFRHFDRVIHHLDRQGIVAHVMIYVWNKLVNWPDMYSKADNMYFDYVISRYQAFPNIIWDVSKEALDYGRCDIPYINERISRIRKRDAYQRLVTVHDYEYCFSEPDRVDFISVQNWRPNLYDHMLQARERHSNKPVVNIEHGGYETGPYKSFTGLYTSGEKCLVRNYECIFAGVYPSYYWQNSAWNIVVYDAFNPSHGTHPRYDYYKHMTGFFKRYDFNKLFPVAQKLTTNGNHSLDNLSNGGLPLTNGKDLFVFLVPEMMEQISVVLPKPGQDKFEVVWFNPFTGEYKEEGVQQWSRWKTLQIPWKNTTSILITKILD